MNTHQIDDETKARIATYRAEQVRQSQAIIQSIEDEYFAQPLELRKALLPCYKQVLALAAERSGFPSKS